VVVAAVVAAVVVVAGAAVVVVATAVVVVAAVVAAGVAVSPQAASNIAKIDNTVSTLINFFRDISAPPKLGKQRYR
jgi:hypothetical protein